MRGISTMNALSMTPHISTQMEYKVWVSLSGVAVSRLVVAITAQCKECRYLLERLPCSSSCSRAIHSPPPSAKHKLAFLELQRWLLQTHLMQTYAWNVGGCGGHDIGSRKVPD